MSYHLQRDKPVINPLIQPAECEKGSGIRGARYCRRRAEIVGEG